MEVQEEQENFFKNKFIMHYKFEKKVARNSHNDLEGTAILQHIPNTNM